MENKSKTQTKKELPKKKLRKKDIRRAKRWPLKYYNENGKLPGRLKIEIGAKCKQSVARAALTELKEELGIKTP